MSTTPRSPARPSGAPAGDATRAKAREIVDSSDEDVDEKASLAEGAAGRLGVTVGDDRDGAAGERSPQTSQSERNRKTLVVSSKDTAGTPAGRLQDENDGKSALEMVRQRSTGKQHTQSPPQLHFRGRILRGRA